MEYSEKDKIEGILNMVSQLGNYGGWNKSYWGADDDEDKDKYSTKDMTEDELAAEREELEEATEKAKKKTRAVERLRVKLKKEHDKVQVLRKKLESLVAKYGDMEDSAALLADSLFNNPEETP